MRLRAATVMAAVAALVAIAAPPALASRLPTAPGRPSAPAAGQLSAQIRYTTGGVPHILAHDWTSLGFGYGYAFAQDNLCTQVVTWPAHGACPVGATILTYSESSNPASPHFADQTKLFSAKRFLPDRFCPAQIAADPNLQTVTVTGH